jgi:epoxide hydrolase
MTTDRRVSSFAVRVPEAELADLRDRLARARLPEAETVRGAAPGPGRWAQGVPLADLSDLAAYWRSDYDWRRLEIDLDRAGDQLRVEIDGLQVHVLHGRSPRPDARPLLLTHGWPGSVAEFLDVLPELASPTDPSAPAFHVVVPSLPGFGFSAKPTEPGWGVERIADGWAELMGILGYDRFLAHGGDWGALVTTALAARHPDRVAAMHTTFPQVPPGLPTAGLTQAELAWVRDTRDFARDRSAYARQQATRPQTIGYGLVDSPLALLAWILDKFADWTDTVDSPFERIDRDRLLDNVGLHWFGRSGASSARLYWESYGRLDPGLVVDVPTAVTVFPREIEKYPRSWVAARYRDLSSWSTPAVGGHFPSLEVPEVFVAELRSAFAEPPAGGPRPWR